LVCSALILFLVFNIFLHHFWIKANCIDTVAPSPEVITPIGLLFQIWKLLKYANRGYILENGSIILQGLSEDLRGNKEVQRAYLGSDKTKKWER